MKAYFNNLCIFVYSRLMTLKNEERGAVDIVAVVVLIGIAVALAIIFRRQIENLLNTLLGQITSGAGEAMQMP